MTTHEIERSPVIVQFEDNSSFTETYGFVGSQGYVFLEGQLILPRDVKSDTIFLFMHPATTLNLMPFPAGLAAAGCHVLCCGSRYAKNDTALIMEKVLVDLGAYVRYAKEDLGYKNVVMMGWSGGGSLTFFYQAQALNPTITHTPAGDPVDITKAGLIPADLVVFIAAHIGRAKILTEWIDPSVKDEMNPDDRIAELDLFHPDNADKSPYDRDWVGRFRAAQLDRIHRITARVEETLAELKARGGLELERAFITHRTMADPRHFDVTLEPNGRKPNWCYLGDPETVNVGPVGIGRFSTLRAWMSQWSEKSNADGLICATQVDTPLLLVENQADDATPPSHTRDIFEVSASPDKTMHVIDGATHYYKDQPEKLVEAVGHVTDWVKAKGLID
ncbi:MAG: alpha/beta fold hydrolase [Alphaproteobacteria bacterium]|jgi:pimeloyl-ACP methyl ester carboxylesterase|nr:alpha/beta fold hydrolase [Alphaproteobacteria bacterium]MBT4083116.1 alpha/beta fold hydrolase [Alphaproteobacteria bacterium]MBT4542372.1 alpha/beta fold hydrolase [Alphaproteobacteria bacterium]MBT5160002.1 alpha/beta fold hydrolase [Alphaproteobacteria bacterium]MBT7747269.1 alpha/beta fold hydrolase [Alphaproteobacteria bacterium]